MKFPRIIISLFVLYFIHVEVIAQSYTPMLDKYNEWHLTSCYASCLTDVYYTNGDTSIGELTYKVLDGFHYISRTFLLREDVPNRKVYLLFSGNEPFASEHLLYDFSIQVGDTFEMSNVISPFAEEPGGFICDSIISKPLVNGNFKHFYFHPIDAMRAGTDLAIWVEGVGTLSMVNAPGGKPDINAVGYLSCYFKNGKLFYQNLDSIDNCISRFTPTSIEKSPNNLFEIITNHALNNVRIKSETFPFSYQIVDLNGRLLGKAENLYTEDLNVSLENYPLGIFILQLRDSKGYVEVERILRLR